VLISVITAVGQHETASMCSVFSFPIILYVVLFDRVGHKVMSFYGIVHRTVECDIKYKVLSMFAVGVPG
jgi:hypothetical protein